MKMDATSKVQKYLADLGHDDTLSHKSSKLQGVRGPGQAAQDPLQFVAGAVGSSMAQRAQQIVNLTEQQKRLRDKQTDSAPRFAEEESWQDDLDTWRRRRRNRISNEETQTRREDEDYGKEETYANTYKDSKEEILTISSPSQDDNNDSGIENRASNSHSPSTSLEFSPRSDNPLTSPSKSVILEELQRTQSPPPPSYAPPPPPAKDRLDQVLIPLSTVPNPRPSRSLAPSSDDYPLPPVHLRPVSRQTEPPFTSSDLLSPTRARASATFTAAPIKETQPFEVTSLKHHDKPVNVELTVELNREQKAQVSATKFPLRRDPRPLETSRESIDRSYSSTRVSENQSPPSSFSLLSHSVSSPTVLPSTSPQTPSTQSHKMAPTVYRTVDIHFDDSAATYQPPRRDKDGLLQICIEMGSQPVHKGFGFTIGSDKGKSIVESVVVGTPADRAGLLIGDRIHSINGQSVSSLFPSAISRIIQDSARTGEVHLAVERSPLKSLPSSLPMQSFRSSSTHEFEQKKSVFVEKPVDSYAEFKRRHSRAPRDVPSPRDYNSLPRSASGGHAPYDVIPRRRDNSLSGSRSTQDVSNPYGSSRSLSSGPDYRVTSLHEKAGPGRLSDFVPEVERQSGNNASAGRVSGNSEEPTTIRNYEVAPTNKKYTTSSSIITPSPVPLPSSDVPVTVTQSRSTLPRKSSSTPVEDHQDDDTVPGKSFLESRDWRDVINEQRRPAPGMTRDTEKIRNVANSMSNLPSIIDRKTEEARRLEREGNEYSYSVMERRRPVETVERTTYDVVEKSYTPVANYSNQTTNYTSPRFGAPPTLSSSGSNYTDPRSNYNQEYKSIYQKDTGYGQSGYRKEETSVVRDQSTNYKEQSSNYKTGLTSNYTAGQSSNYKEEIKREPENQKEQVVAVSGKHRCAHCGDELGRGAAMIVESLSLFYHLACFKCYVCKTTLGSGTTGADVRVREGRLHCQSCYSNDRLQLSKV